MTCEENRELLSAYLDRELSATDQRSVQAHVETCVACREHQHELLQVKELLRGQSMPALPVEVIARIESKTTQATHWWTIDIGRFRWVAPALGFAAAMGGWFFFRTLHSLAVGQPVAVIVAKYPVRRDHRPAQDRVALNQRDENDPPPAQDLH